jgi:hypothetical protein
MTVKTQYNIGDIVWIYGIVRNNTRLTQGKVIKIFNLSDCGYNEEPQYLIEIPTEIEPLLEVRTWHMISQDKDGPVGSLRNIMSFDATTKLVSHAGYEYDNETDPGDPTPEQIHAAMERDRQNSSHSPLVLKDAKPKRRHYPRKKKV